MSPSTLPVIIAGLFLVGGLAGLVAVVKRLDPAYQQDQDLDASNDNFDADPAPNPAVVFLGALLVCCLPVSSILLWATWA